MFVSVMRGSGNIYLPLMSAIHYRLCSMRSNVQKSAMRLSCISSMPV